MPRGYGGATKKVLDMGIAPDEIGTYGGTRL